MIWLDPSFLRAGYLPSADYRHLRWVEGLDRFIPEIIEAGIELFYGDLPGAHSACCSFANRAIYLAPWLYYAMPYVVREHITHEFTHLATGRSCEDFVLMEQRRRYGEFIQPPVWMVA